VEKLSKLRPVFKKDGVVTAANASGICDGAGSIILASEEAVKQHNFKPLARIISYDVIGCDPNIMGIGPGMFSTFHDLIMCIDSYILNS